MNKQSYHLSADIIRVVAIIGVVTIHVFSEFVNTAHQFLTPEWWFANIVDSAARVSVPLFIMLSGYLLLHHEKNYGTKEFLTKRLSRIGIPLLVWPLFYYGWKLYISHNQFSFDKFFSDIISMSVYYHLYYLYVIVGLYLITPPLKVFLMHTHRHMQQYLLGLTCVFSLSIMLSKYFLPIGFNLATIFSVFLPYVVYYLAGDYVRNIILTKKHLLLLTMSYVVLIFATAIGNKWYMEFVHWSTKTTPNNATYDRYFYDYVSLPVVAMSIIVFIILLNLPNVFTFANHFIVEKIVKQISFTSFGVYLLHPFLLDVSNRYGILTLGHIPIPLWLFLVVKTAIIFFVSFIIISIIQRIPLIKTIVG